MSTPATVVASVTFLLLAGAPVAVAAGDNVSTTRATTDGPIRSDREIDASEIDRAGADRLDEALEWIPGLQLGRSSGLGTTATVDGLPPSQIVILVDGAPIRRPLNSRAGPATDLASLPIPAGEIRRIEVYHGAGPGGSGAAGGVVVNIVTRDAEPRLRFDAQARGGLAADLGAFSEAGGSATITVPLGETWFIRAGVDASVEAPLDSDGDRSPDQPEHRIGSGRFGLGWAPTASRRLELRASYTDTRTTRLALTDDAVRRLRSDSPIALNGLFDDRTELGLLDVRLNGRHRITRDVRLRHETAVFRQAYDFDKRRVRDGNEERVHRTEDLNLRQSVVANVFAGDHELEPELTLQGGTTSRRGDASRIDDERISVGLGLSERWTASERTTLEVRGLSEVHSDFGIGGLARIALGVQATTPLLLRLSGSVTRRVPTPEELFFRFDHSEVGYVIEGNPALQPERLLGTRAGFRLDDGTTSLDVDAYYHVLDDAITSEPLSFAQGAATYRYVNTERVRSSGINTQAGWRDLPGGLAVRVGYAYLPFSEMSSTGERLPFSARHDLRTQLTGAWVDDRVEAWVSVAHRSGLTLPEGAVGARSLTTLDVGAGWQMTDALRAQLDVDNLTGAFDPTWGPYVRRTIFLSLSYRTEAQ